MTISSINSKVKSRSHKLDADNVKLQKFGFIFNQASVHTSRTMMFSELQLLFAFYNFELKPRQSQELNSNQCLINFNIDKTDFHKAIIEENCLGKPTFITRALTARHLSTLYGLDPKLTIFRLLLYFWSQDEESRRLLAFLCAFSRDNLLQAIAPVIIKMPLGSIVAPAKVAQIIESIFPHRFSPATLESTAQNINSTMTQAGFLKGHRHKTRTAITPTTAIVSYALVLGYLTGLAGQSLFTSKFTNLLDCSEEVLLELTYKASHKDWLRISRLGNITDVSFTSLLTGNEIRWLNEPN